MLRLVLLPLVAAAAFGESEESASARIAARNIKSFQEQTQYMVDAWQEACKIDIACSNADPAILAKVYSYYVPSMKCSGSRGFIAVAPADVPHTDIDGFDNSKAGYDLKGVHVKECFAHDTTVMSVGDLDYGVQNIAEEFGVVPDTGGKVIFVAASFDIGWGGKPLRCTSVYRYEFDDDGLIVSWDATYDAIMVYAALRQPTQSVALAAEPVPSPLAPAPFAAGVLVGAAGVLLLMGGARLAGPML